MDPRAWDPNLTGTAHSARVPNSANHRCSDVTRTTPATKSHLANHLATVASFLTIDGVYWSTYSPTHSPNSTITNRTSRVANPF